VDFSRRRWRGTVRRLSSAPSSGLWRLFALGGGATEVGAEDVHLGRRQIGHGREAESPLGLLEQGKAVAGLRARLDRAADDGDRHFARGDLVLAALTDERRDPGGADDVYPAAHHGEPVRLEIDDGRGARDLARQPRLDRMPVRRRDTDRLPGKAAPDKAGDDAALGSA